MSRYVAVPAKSWGSATEYSWQERPTCHVVESDPTPVKTGLLDHTGTPIYHVPERVPIGFHNRQVAKP